MNKFKLLITSILLLITFSSFSQENKKAERMFNDAIKLYQKKHYSEAIKKLDDILEIIPNSPKALMLKGDIYNDFGDFQKAVEEYKKSYNSDPNFYPATTYIIGDVYFKNQDYKNAKIFYNKYLMNGSPRKELVDKINSMIPICNFRDSLMQNPVNCKIRNLGSNVNSPGYEYVNAVSLDESLMYFTRKDANINSNENIFTANSAVNEAGERNWGSVKEIGKPISTDGNEGALCVSPDGTVIILTICNRRDTYGSCDLYFSNKLIDGWSEPINLGPDVNTKQWESQPTFAADGKTLYFVSNRSGGFGGSDIYMSKMDEKGYWSRPENLGPNINTSADEMSPFIHSDQKTLYFSSKGHLGMGGADLFVSKIGKDGKWQKPTNLGYPINTKDDEINLLLNASGTQAYISSQREDTKGFTDIYTFDLPQSVRPEFMAFIKGKVFDKETFKPLWAKFEILDMTQDSVIISSWSDPTNGEFIMSLPVDKNYALNVSCKGYLFYSHSFSLENYKKQNKTEILEIPMQAIKIGESVTLKNIFFATNKSELLPESRAELNKLVKFLKSMTDITIEISGHTDNVGTDAYNNVLSNDRANAVYNYLINNGIPSERLSYKGYGKTKPIDTNDTEEGRANNRRTEFKIIDKK